MSHGGKRKNAGRKAGAVTVRTREIADKAAAEGLTPLEVMLDNMRFYHEAARVALDRLLNGASPTDIVTEHNPKGVDPEHPPGAIEAVALILKLREHAGNAAKEAAPYLHPRLSTVEGKGKRPEDEEIPLVERLKRYATAEAIKDSGGKVVPLKVSNEPAPTGNNRKAKA